MTSLNPDTVRAYITLCGDKAPRSINILTTTFPKGRKRTVLDRNVIKACLGSSNFRIIEFDAGGKKLSDTDTIPPPIRVTPKSVVTIKPELSEAPSQEDKGTAEEQTARFQAAEQKWIDDASKESGDAPEPAPEPDAISSEHLAWDSTMNKTKLAAALTSRTGVDVDVSATTRKALLTLLDEFDADDE